jgi:pyrroline-5-carboxylate reductase
MNFGVIGCGKMGSALVSGAVRSGALSSSHVWGLDPVAAASAEFCCPN